MILDEVISWAPLAIWTAVVFGAGRHYEKEKQRTREADLAQRDFDLGVLFPLLGELELGVKSREQADDEMRRSTYKSASSLWFNMCEKERSLLGKRALALTNDPAWRKQSEANAAWLREALHKE